MLGQARVDLYNKPTGLNLFAGSLTAVLFVVAWVSLLGYWRNQRAGRLREGEHYFVFLVYGTIVFQLVHTLEHLLQIVFWVRHPYSLPWLSPWALAAQKGLTSLFDPQARVQTGNELLHLLGNGIFFAGLVAMVHALKITGARKQDRRWSMWALRVQGFHLAEHIALTSTWLFLGVPRGITTLFGVAYSFSSPWASGYRIVWHFFLNFMPTVFVIAGLGELRHKNLLLEDGLAKALDSARKAAVEDSSTR